MPVAAPAADFFERQDWSYQESNSQYSSPYILQKKHTVFQLWVLFLIWLLVKITIYHKHAPKYLLICIVLIALTIGWVKCSSQIYKRPNWSGCKKVHEVWKINFMFSCFEEVEVSSTTALNRGCSSRVNVFMSARTLQNLGLCIERKLLILLIALAFYFP